MVEGRQGSGSIDLSQSRHGRQKRHPATRAYHYFQRPASQSRRRPGSRAALIAGFGALLVLMAIIGLDSLRTLRAFETSNVQIRHDFLYLERTLEQVRAGLYETGNMIRDYILIESDPYGQEMLRTEFQSIRNETTAI